MTVLLVQPEDDPPAIQALEFFAGTSDVFSVTGLDAALEYLNSEGAELALLNSSQSEILDSCEQLLQRRPGLPVAVALPQQSLSQKVLSRALHIGLVGIIELGENTGSTPTQAINELVERVRIRNNYAVNSSADTVLEHARELEHDQQAGSYIQSRMLPTTPQQFEEYLLSYKVIPTLYMSGDFVDYFQISDHHFLFYMADVSGHGAGSAFVTVLLKNFSNHLCHDHTPEMLQNPGIILAQLNDELLGNRIDKHVSMFIGVVDMRNNTLSYSGAGHFPNAILAIGSESRFIEMQGKPVGLFENVNYASAKLELEEDIQLVLVSDGILDLLPGGDLVTKEQTLLRNVAQAKSERREIWDLFELPEIFDGSDDVSFLSISRCGKSCR